MMTTYTRRGPGQSYLKTILAERINSLIELKDLDLEINPLKIYEKMVQKSEDEIGKPPDDMPKGVTAEQAAANPRVQEAIIPRVQMLTEIANAFLDTIIRGLEEIPYGIRWICKQIRSLSRRKYPDAQDHTICTLIGGFFFLRFINPAIISPISYMLIDSAPEECPKRTLTYVAKMLQNLANKPSASKEPYMQVLQPFLEENKERIGKFLLDICEARHRTRKVVRSVSMYHMANFFNRSRMRAHTLTSCSKDWDRHRLNSLARKTERLASPCSASGKCP